MEKNRRFTIGYSIIAFLLIVAVQLFLLAPPVDHIPYSDWSAERSPKGYVARSMVKEYGMSSRLGPVSFERAVQPGILNGAQVSSGRDYSEKVAEEIDLEVREILQKAHERVREILVKHRSVLERVAKLLLAREVLEGEELRKILKEQVGQTAREPIPETTQEHSRS